MRQPQTKQPQPHLKKKKATTKKGASKDEVAGADAEGTYFDTDSLAAVSDRSYDMDLAASSDFDDDCSEPEFDPDGEIVDEEDEYLPMFSYDADDLCIDVNMVFPDVDQCKSAVTHHAILRDHAFHIVKKTRKDLRPYARELNNVASGPFCICKQEICWMQGK